MRQCGSQFEAWSSGESSRYQQTIKRQIINGHVWTLWWVSWTSASWSISSFPTASRQLLCSWLKFTMDLVCSAMSKWESRWLIRLTPANHQERWKKVQFLLLVLLVFILTTSSTPGWRTHLANSVWSATARTAGGRVLNCSVPLRTSRKQHVNSHSFTMVHR